MSLAYILEFLYTRLLQLLIALFIGKAFVSMARLSLSCLCRSGSNSNLTYELARAFGVTLGKIFPSYKF